MANSMYDIRNEADTFQKGLRNCPFCGGEKIKISINFWTKYSKDVNRVKAQCYCTSCSARGPREVILCDLEWKPIHRNPFKAVREGWGLE